MSKYSRLNANAGDDVGGNILEPVPPLCIGLYNHFRDSFKSLKTCPRELYINFFLKFCESYGYFSISQILVIYLHNEFGASDVRAGAIYGAWGACITFWGLTISWLNNNFGVRNSLLFGFAISLISSLILATATSLTTICVVLFCFMPMGTAMGIPMLTVGIKRYTNTANRGFAFGLYYSVMNVAAFVSGPVVDLFNIGFKSGITVLGVHWTGNRLVILTTTCTYLTSFVVTYAFLREIRVQQLPLEGEEEDGTQTGIGVGTVTGAGARAEARNPDERSDFTNTSQQRAMDQEKGKQLIERDIENTIEMRNFARKVDAASSSSLHHRSSAHTTNVLHSRAELFTIDDDDDDEDDEKENENEGAENDRFSAEALSAADSINFSNNNNNNTTIANQDQNGANLANYEEYKPVQRGLYSIWGELLHSPTFWRFSVLTLFLINLNTIFRHLDATLPTYLVRCFGSNYPKGIIYSINPFIIMWLTPVIAALTSKSAHYDMIKYGGYVSAASPFFLAMATQTWAVVMFVVFLSLGEAVWSPRVYDYTMSIAPEGREASFSALAAAPLFAAKIPVGLLSGYLVSTYLPEDGSKPDGQTMWLILGIITMTSPLLITIFEPCVREPVKATKVRPTSNSGAAPSGSSTTTRSIKGEDSQFSHSPFSLQVPPSQFLDSRDGDCGVEGGASVALAESSPGSQQVQQELSGGSGTAGGAGMQTGRIISSGLQQGRGAQYSTLSGAEDV